MAARGPARLLICKHRLAVVGIGAALHRPYRGSPYRDVRLLDLVTGFSYEADRCSLDTPWRSDKGRLAVFT